MQPRLEACEPTASLSGMMNRIPGHETGQPSRELTNSLVAFAALKLRSWQWNWTSSGEFSRHLARFRHA